MQATTGHLSGETIICLAPDRWVGLWRNRHQIMTRLARNNTVLYVEPRLYLWQTLRYFLSGRLRPASLRRPLAEHYAERLWIYHDPYYAPVSGRRSGGPLTAGWRRKAMLRTLRQVGAKLPPILWMVRPYFADIIGQYGEKLLVYHVTDEYSAYANVADRNAALEAEQALLRRADLVIVTSPGLLASKGRFNPCTYLVPNAVDYQGFQEVMAKDAPIAALRAPDEPGAIPAPRIGYSGALNEKLDYELLAGIARARPDWQLVLIGGLDLFYQPRRADCLQGLPNVHWIGRLPVSQLPPAIAALDVCLLPYERNEWTANIDSLKLYEYLACGRPVVSSDIPAARAFSEVVRVVSTPTDTHGAVSGWVAEITAALAEKDPAPVEQRKAIAAQNTWDQRVERIGSLLVEALARKTAQV